MENVSIYRSLTNIEAQTPQYAKPLSVTRFEKFSSRNRLSAGSLRVTLYRIVLEIDRSFEAAVEEMSGSRCHMFCVVKLGLASGTRDDDFPLGC